MPNGHPTHTTRMRLDGLSAIANISRSSPLLKQNVLKEIKFFISSSFQYIFDTYCILLSGITGEPTKKYI